MLQESIHFYLANTNSGNQIIQQVSESIGANTQYYLQYNSMNCKIKNHLLSKQFISKFAFNHTHNILACIIDAADTIAFYHLTPHTHQLIEIFAGTSKPSGKKSSLVWSNDGQYLALGSHNLQLWMFDGTKMVPKKVFAQDFIELKLIAWSPDSTLIAYGGLSKKNHIKIKKIQTGVSQQLSIPLAASAISYDPFGKYMLVLMRSNIVYLYDSQNHAKLKQIVLSPQASPLKNAITVRELRGMAWSPDFSHFVCPSLDDSKVALAIDLRRSSNFNVNQAFLGHISSISCAKFNPCLYSYQGDTTSILALGDSHGIISLWRVGTKIYNTPLLMLNSNNEYHEVVEQIDWDATGQILIVNVLKRYVTTVCFDKARFGRQISQSQKALIIQENYGAKSASEINKNIQIFSISSLTSSTPLDFTQRTAIRPTSIPQNFIPGTANLSLNANKVEYVKINEQVTIKDKNNKKKIQPALLVRKEDAQKIATQLTQPVPNNNTLLYATIVTHQPLKLKPIQLQPKLIRISSRKMLQFKKIQGFTIVQLYDSRQGQRSLVNERVFTSNVDWVKVLNARIYLLNQGNLYIFDEQLNLTELPYAIGQVHRIAVNEQGDVYYLGTKGGIRGFNYIRYICYTPVPVLLQTLLESAKKQEIAINQTNGEVKDDQSEGFIQDFSVQNNHNLYLVLKRNKLRYFYSRDTQTWISLELNSGVLKPGNSLRIAEHESKLAADFFNSLTIRPVSSQAKSVLSLQQIECNMVYYKKYSPNAQLYRENLLALIRQLKNRNQTAKLRAELIKYFVDQHSEFYERDGKLREKVKMIGGSVIQEFILFGKL